MKQLRILTTVHFANPGACLFTESLYKILLDNLPDYDVRTLDYVPRNWLYYEKLRACKPQPNIPLYNLQRHKVSEKFYRQHTNLDKPALVYPFGYEGMVKFLSSRQYDALVVGMVIWDLTGLWQIPQFPNIYWLSEKIPATKIAYAASGHRSKASLIQKNLPAIQRILGSYALIGVRDQITLEMVLQSKVNEYVPVFKVPDPVFLYQEKPTRIREILVKHGIDLDRPILGLLFYDKPAFSQELSAFYRARGYQTVAFSMYNPFADVNLGHIITPYEWAELFNILSLCVTDRFHGTAFCLKANIPFVSIEPYQPNTIKNSKILSLINDFGLTDCYVDVDRDDFSMPAFLESLENLRVSWTEIYRPRVEQKLIEMQQRSRDFVQMIRQVLND